MLRPIRPLIAALLATAAAAPAWSAAPEKQLFQVTNTALRPADCAIVVDGKTRTYLKIRPGKTWADNFDPRRTIQLVCDRAVGDGVWAMKAGTRYRLLDGAGGKVDFAEKAGED